MSKLPSGCYFHPRCNLANDNCKVNKPELTKVSENRKSRCFEYNKLM